MKIFTKALVLVASVAFGGRASAQTLYDNFENTRLVTYPSTGGTFTPTTANPGSIAANSSATCALYTRDAALQYAVIVVKPTNARMADVSAYAAGTKRISIKFRSPAVGTVVQAVLQNGAKASADKYPLGKFGGDFNATTTVANAWETLTFTYTAASAGNFDPTVLATDVDQMVLLVAPGTNTGPTCYLDDITGPELIAGPTTQLAVSQLYDNYQGSRTIKYIAAKSSGSLNADTLSPAAGTAANGTRVARYTRSTNQYDVLVVQPRGAALADVSAFKSNTLHMTMRVFSPAAGIPFQITLQDSTVANGSNYPAGRNSEYTATTKATNAWETLSFDFLGAPSATPNTGLNEIVLLIASNTTVRRKVYLDDWTGPSLVGYVPTASRTVQTASAAFAPAFPNPTSGRTQLPFSLQKPAVVSLAVYDNLGRRVAQVLNGETRPAGPHTAELDAAKLASGLYTCRLTVDGVALSRSLSVE